MGMKTTKAISLVLFIALLILPKAYAENIAEWQDARLSATIYGHQVDVRATRAGDFLASLTVTFDGRDGVVPEKEVMKHKQPHLGTLKLHTWTKDLEQFYVSMEFWPEPLPYTIYFLFRNGQYLSQEKLRFTNTEGKSYEPLPPAGL